MSTPPRSVEQQKAAEAALRRSGVAQPLWPALLRKAAWALTMISAIMACVSVVYVVASIVCSWVLYFYNTMTEPWVFLWACVTGIVTYLGPPPPPTLTAKITEAAENAQDAMVRTVLSVETLSWLCGGTTITVFAYCCSIIIASYVKRTLWRFKGYEWEGLQRGSDFGSGRAPPCQVQISWLGALREKHSGYGIRCGQVLAVPLHVIRNQEQVLLTSHRGVKMIVPVQVIESITMNDVGYLQLSETAWSKLGVKDSTVAFTMGIASCTGLSGTSVGRVSRSSTLGLLTYKGSTVPGMSGAAYAINSQVCGMHVGMVRGLNAGVSMELIALELKKLTQESAIGVGDDEEIAREQPIWSEKDLKRVVAEAYDDVRVSDRWYDQSRKEVLEAVRRGIAIDWAAEEAATAAKRPCPKPRTVRFDYAQQSDDAPAAVLEVRTVTSRVMDLEDEVSELKQKLEQVQGRLAVLEGKREVATPKPKEYLKCEFCDSCTLTAAGMEKHVRASHPVKAPKVLVKCEFCDESLPEKSMANHLANSHRPREEFVCDCGLKCRTELRLNNHKLTCTYKPESAFPSDFKKSVKQDRFLGQRRNQRTTRRENSPAGSSKSTSRGPSQSREEPPNELMGFLRHLNSTLENLQKDMGGLTSAIMQKSDH